MIQITLALLAVLAFWNVNWAKTTSHNSIPLATRVHNLEGQVHFLRVRDKRLVAFVRCLKNSGVVGLDDSGGYAVYWTNPFDKDVRAFAFDSALDKNGCLVFGKNGW